jgi:protein PhnA
MTTEDILHARSGSKCELCNASEALEIHEVSYGASEVGPENSLLLCGTCRAQIGEPEKANVHHWRCLSESMWSPTPAVQVMAWRILNQLRAEDWARDLLDMLYLEDATLAWAKASPAETSDIEDIKHLDCNGVLLSAGDDVTLIKDLNVKGAGFTAKRGTVVRGISLVHDNAAQIEGRVNSQRIVILTEFVKKSN